MSQKPCSRPYSMIQQFIFKKLFGFFAYHTTIGGPGGARSFHPELLGALPETTRSVRFCIRDSSLYFFASARPHGMLDFCICFLVSTISATHPAAGNSSRSSMFVANVLLQPLLARSWRGLGAAFVAWHRLASSSVDLNPCVILMLRGVLQITVFE